MNIRILILAGALVACAAQARAMDRNFEEKVAAAPNGSIEISNVAGSLDIQGWDRPEVEVKGEIGEGVERVDVKSSDGRTYVKVVVKKSTRDGEAQLTINVPKGSEVNASAVSADIDSKGVTGRQRLTTVSGEISAEVAATSQVKSVSGDIVLRSSQQPAELRLSTVSGNLRVERGAGDVEATSVSGDISLQVNPARTVRLHSTSGGLEFEGQLSKDGSLEAETVSGEVGLHVAGRYDYEVTSFAGEIESCLGKKPERAQPYGPGSRLDGSLGEGGGGRVRVKSMSGDINLCDK
jgi:DUF4097 and DUF4098 domain-containing protein YvlB